jgi:hypothetical protein
MSTYDKASLVLIPSGTKEGVVFPKSLLMEMVILHFPEQLLQQGLMQMG